MLAKKMREKKMKKEEKEENLRKFFQKLGNDLPLHRREGLSEKMIDSLTPALIVVYTAVKLEVTKKHFEFIENLKDDLKIASGCSADAQKIKRQILFQKDNSDSIILSNTNDIMYTLFSFLYTIRLAIRGIKGYAEGSGIVSFYFLPLVENFVIPAIENCLSPNWGTDAVWQTADTQILQILPWRMNFSWSTPYADMKKILSPTMLSSLVKCVCEKECDVTLPNLKSYVAKLHEERKDWPSD